MFSYIDSMKPDCTIQSYCNVASLLFWGNNLPIPMPNSTRPPLPLWSNNATLEKIDGVMVIPRIVLIMGK